ncbi:hypothetical protein RHSIM_Rhsim11G0014600 [Rhododendron simsii]|uniref:Uncharacterized protein n=1 Tax=Rhododendron simsii TaxID=118357 RepID=A0A834GCG6_RHOSS|nr:hypothetical protein RHSIM_Rhsim11G0014600 [Rhododendron simsii]
MSRSIGVSPEMVGGFIYWILLWGLPEKGLTADRVHRRGASSEMSGGSGGSFGLKQIVLKEEKRNRHMRISPHLTLSQLLNLEEEMLDNVFDDVVRAPEPEVQAGHLGEYGSEIEIRHPSSELEIYGCGGGGGGAVAERGMGGLQGWGNRTNM